MRWVIGALLVMGFAPHALAADLDILRGSEPVGSAPFTNWTGFYFGGHWGVSDGNGDFSQSTAPPLAFQLRDTALEVKSAPSDLPVLGTADQTAMSYGGFVGYNSQWDQLILGAELGFNHTTLSLNAPDTPIARSGLSDGQGNSYTVLISGDGSVTDLNYGEIRGRAGLIMGDFLPYGFIGAAVGLANLNVTANIAGSCEPGSTATCSNFAFSTSAGRNPAILYGGAVGGGVDYAVTQNIFLRGEFEYLRFAPFASVVIAVSSAHVGAGIKF